MTARGDQKVGRDALDRYQVLRKELDAAILELNKALGVGNAKRVPSLPEFPTIAESGLPGYDERCDKGAALIRPLAVDARLEPAARVGLLIECRREARRLGRETRRLRLERASQLCLFLLKGLGLRTRRGFGLRASGSFGQCCARGGSLSQLVRLAQLRAQRLELSVVLRRA
jgi:hypothetical protein